MEEMLLNGFYILMNFDNGFWSSKVNELYFDEKNLKLKSESFEGIAEKMKFEAFALSLTAQTSKINLFPSKNSWSLKKINQKSVKRKSTKRLKLFILIGE